MVLKRIFNRKERTGEGGDVEMKLVVGLGNPGEKYAKTRHNVGFDVIDQCVEELDIPLNQSKFKGIFGFKNIQGEKIFLLKPLTYMNLSGESIAPIMKYYKIPVENVLVIYDDLDLQPGKIRLRQKGSHGGHNGMKSIISHLGTDQFKRIRIGIGHPQPGVPVPDFVLGSFHPEERKLIDKATLKAKEAVISWTKTSFLNVMNEFNK